MIMRVLLGEAIGTFILVFVGTGSVALSLLYPLELWHVAFIWAVGVSLGIYAAKPFSDAHLNPAVTIGFLVANYQKEKKNVLPNISGQVIGATLGAMLIFVIFGTSFSELEKLNDLTNSGIYSIATACAFGEFYPNPAFAKEVGDVSTGLAFLFELGGTFLLMASIFVIVTDARIRKVAPILIGLTVSVLIFWIAPYTQAGFNPARDFMPRIFSYFVGWSESAFTNGGLNTLIVYVAGPIIGAGIAAIAYRIYTKRVPNNKLTLGK